MYVSGSPAPAPMLLSTNKAQQRMLYQVLREAVITGEEVRDPRERCVPGVDERLEGQELIRYRHRHLLSPT
jgi:hypothetical protein